MPAKLTHEEFIKQLDIKQPLRSYEIIGIYNNLDDKILTRNKYGECLSTTRNLLKTSKLSIQTAINKTEYFINMAKEKHGEKYDYSLVKYKNNYTKVKIICNISKHGLFEQIPNNHLQGAGCCKCRNKNNSLRQRLTTKEFIRKVKEIHGDTYIYDRVIYGKNNIEKVEIECRVHSYFWQSPDEHLRGRGCSICGKINSGFTKRKFISRCQNGNAIIYLIKCHNNNEKFYKIGITSNSIRQRFQSGKSIPYNYDIIYEFQSNAGIIYDLEKELHRRYKQYKYLPKFSFKGRTECFNLELPIEEISKNI